MPAHVSKESLLLQLIGQIYCCKKIDELKTIILDGICSLIPYESAAFFLVDPSNMQYKEPLFRYLDPQWFEKYSDYYEEKDIYKKTVFAEGIPCIDRSSDYMEYRQWEKNEHRADFLLPQGIYNICCLQIVDERNLVGEISLHRNNRQPDFQSEETRLLLLLHDHINNAFSRFKLQSQRDTLLKLIKEIHFQENSGYILMNKNYKIINYNKAASLLFDMKVEGRRFTERLKAEFKCLMKKEAGHIIPNLCKKNHLLGRYGKIVYSNTIITDSDGEIYLLTLIEDLPITDLEYQDLSKYNITRREREIAFLISQGKTNLEICSQLFISENTIKTHIKQLYSKLNVKNRNEMVFKIFNNYQDVDWR